jgi:hypothetical protein
MKEHLLFTCLFCIGLSFGQSHTELEQVYLKTQHAPHAELKEFSFLSVDSLKRDSTSTLTINVLPDALVAYEPNGFAVRSGLAFGLEGTLGKKWALRSSYRLGYTNRGDVAYLSSLQAKSLFRNTFTGESALYHDVRGRLTYTPNEIFTVETGIDHLYIGEGERSLLAGNQGVPLPFIQAKAKFWKFQYLFSQQVGFEDRQETRTPKGIATHYLGFQASKKWNFGIFETVVYDMYDTLYNRGFEPEYLNPLIFYRPQEYSLGSADNVMIGLHTSYSFGKHKAYGQFILDEFLLAELRARSRWWANKYGFQLGVKGLFTAKGREVFYRTELNLVRPFTYAHTAPGVVYGNAALPIAHPLGSNFMELYHEFATTLGAWRVEVWLQLYVKGNNDPDTNLSYGGDIYESYINYADEYNFTIGRGHTTHAFQVGTQVSKRFLNDQCRFFIEPRVQFYSIERDNTVRFFLTTGIHVPLGAARRNY